MRNANGVFVRLVRPGDAEQLSAVYDALGYPSTAGQITARLERIGCDPSYGTWAAELDGHTAGFAGARVGWVYEHDAAHVQLLALAVVEEARGRGVGSALLAAVQAWAHDQQAAAVIVHSGRHRDSAHAFYRANGFAATGLRFVKHLGP